MAFKRNKKSVAAVQREEHAHTEAQIDCLFEEVSKATDPANKFQILEEINALISSAEKAAVAEAEKEAVRAGASLKQGWDRELGLGVLIALVAVVPTQGWSMLAWGTPLVGRSIRKSRLKKFITEMERYSSRLEQYKDRSSSLTGAVRKCLSKENTQGPARPAPDLSAKFDSAVKNETAARKPSKINPAHDLDKPSF